MTVWVTESGHGGLFKLKIVGHIGVDAGDAPPTFHWVQLWADAVKMDDNQIE